MTCGRCLVNASPLRPGACPSADCAQCAGPCPGGGCPLRSPVLREAAASRDPMDDLSQWSGGWASSLPRQAPRSAMCKELRPVNSGSPKVTCGAKPLTEVVVRGLFYEEETYPAGDPEGPCCEPRSSDTPPPHPRCPLTPSMPPTPPPPHCLGPSSSRCF